MRRQKSKRSTIIGLLFLIAVVLGINLIPAASLTRAGLERTLQHAAQQMAISAGSKDMKAVLAYDAIEFKGFGLSREASVINPRIEISSADMPGKTVISTEVALVQADAAQPDVINVRIPKPLVFSEDGKALARVDYVEAPIYRYDPGSPAGVQTHQLALPPSGLDIYPDVNDPSAPPVHWTYDAMPVVQVVYDAATKTQVAEYRIQNLRVADGDMQMSVGSLNSKVTRVFDGENHLTADYDFNIQNISLPGEFSYLNPVTLEATLRYTGEADASPLSDTPRSGINEIQVQKLNVLTGRLSGSATGGMKRSADDPLPYGRLEFTLVNLRQAVESAQITEDERNAWIALLQKITSQPFEAMDNATFAVEREKQGEFRVGNASLQEVTALALTGYLNATQPPAAAPLVPDAPPAEQGEPSPDAVDAPPANPLP